jgi:hypothetical protein
VPNLARTTLLTSVVAVTSLALLPAATPFMPVDEVRPGMQGIGRTVFAGASPEEFQVRILGVLRNVVGPQRNLILARLDGGPLADTGVMQGMSGSPVYIDGRLVGAVSYSLGSFPKEPIAGITPIGEMIDATAQVPRAASMRIPVEFPVTPASLAVALRAGLERMRPFAHDSGDLEVLGLSRAIGVELGTQLRPIATPFVMRGFDGAPAAMLQDALLAAGFAPQAGTSQPPAAALSTRLEPGDAVGVLLAGGDFELGASGTVTYVDGDRVYAFGHPFFNLGPTAFPMTRAEVYSLLPSLMTSQKIAALGAVVGTVDQDRATAIAGRLGVAPALIPVHLRLESDRGFERSFSFEVVNDEFFTPILSYLTVANTLSSYERQIGSATFVVKGTARIAGHEDVHLSDLFSGVNAMAGAAAYVAGPITMLMGNDLKAVRVESVDLTVTASERPRTASIQRAWLDAVRPHPGDTVPLKIAVREYGGDDQIYTLPITIPPNAPSSLTLLVADGSALSTWERREQQQAQRPTSVEQIIRLINTQRKNDRLYVRLVAAQPGAVVDGETLPSLPPSVLSVLESDRDGGAFARLRMAVLGSWEVPTDRAISGSRELTITVDTGRP